MRNLFSGKKVTVMGLGLHGGGVACVKWLTKHGASVTVTDLKTAKELSVSLKRIKKTKNQKIKLILGQHRAGDFKNADLIIQNPGVRRESKYLKLARKAGIPIENEASLFFKNCPAQIIGVTGTRGKSTTASLVYEILRHGTRNMKHGTVWLAGLPQQPMLEILDQVKPNDLVVLELSSWQLEILGEQNLSPHIAVFTNIYPDHLNRYFGMASYISAKKNIFTWQNQNDFVILNLDNPQTKKLGQVVVSQRFWFSKKYFTEENGCFVRSGQIFLRRNGGEKRLAKVSDIKLFGWHNLENVLAALAATASFNISPLAIKSALKQFKGLPGRLELIKEKKGIKYINDTTATTPDATIAALRLAKKRNVILLAGGDTKNIPDAKYQELAKIIKQKCKAVILFSGPGSEQLKKQFKSLKFRPFIAELNKMTEAVSLAQSFGKSGDTILLSPASASFNLFINEFDRGDQFKTIVFQL
ncbi:MAG: UDP-N-acetylmuramoyl-L-alanine--D-glutamate ligase [Patescibacteria group bacterium]|jgi:UDP-N-acetylmuramoylalanine--D-glutamate ligase